MTTTAPLSGPAALGIEFGQAAPPDDEGWTSFRWTPPEGLDGPQGILQGGLATGITLAAARAIDPFGAPPTGLAARLFAPTPLGRELELRARPTDRAAVYEVEARDDGHPLVSAEVELAGPEPTPRSLDLLELAEVPLPDPSPKGPFQRCVVCGTDATHPHAMHLYPRWHAPDAVVIPWVCDEDLAPTGTVDLLVVSAVLDCPTVWAAWDVVEARGDVGAVLASYHVTFFRDAPIMEPLRTVARMDEADGRKLRARGALVDEDGVLYATSSALHVCVPELPPVP
jgi:hypothetical protein